VLLVILPVLLVLVEVLQQVLQLAVQEVLLGDVLQLVLLELLHGWEGHGGVERKRNLGALTSCKRGRGPPWPQRTWSALD
jgi:hypothetical protein